MLPASQIVPFCRAWPWPLFFAGCPSGIGRTKAAAFQRLIRIQGNAHPQPVLRYRIWWVAPYEILPKPPCIYKKDSIKRNQKFKSASSATLTGSSALHLSTIGRMATWQGQCKD